MSGGEVELGHDEVSKRDDQAPVAEIEQVECPKQAEHTPPLQRSRRWSARRVGCSFEARVLVHFVEPGDRASAICQRGRLRRRTLPQPWAARAADPSRDGCQIRTRTSYFRPIRHPAQKYGVE
eukprot:scaffold56865_cov71-Phaeocystis_antarctica.AAC.4